MTQTLLKTKAEIFYPLTKSEVIMAKRELTPAERDVFWYIKSATGPWPDHAVELKIADIAKDLGMNRSTVSRALRRLKQAGWITLNVSSVSVTANDILNRDRHAPNAIATHRMRSPRTECDRHAPNAIATHHDIYIDRAREDLIDLIDPPEVGENFFEEKESTDTSLSLLEDQISTLVRGKDMGRGNRSAAASTSINSSVGVLASEDSESIVGEATGMVVDAGTRAVVNTSTGAVVERGADTSIHAATGVVVNPGGEANIGTAKGAVIDANASASVGRAAGAIIKKGAKASISNATGAVVKLQGVIPQSLLDKVIALGIPLDDQVVATLQECHQSQIMSALGHMETTDEEIHSPRSFFLYKAPRMPVEKLGSRLPEYTAADFEKVPLGAPKAVDPRRIFAQYPKLAVLAKK